MKKGARSLMPSCGEQWDYAVVDAAFGSCTLLHDTWKHGSSAVITILPAG